MSLRDRVRSYFVVTRHWPIQTGHRPIPTKTEKLVSQIKKIKFEKTDTVLEALILESNLIKKNQPKYNFKAKDDKSFSYFLITKNEEFSRVLIVRKTDLAKYSTKKIFGPYTSKNQMETALKIIRKIFPFHSRKEKSEKSCLDFQLGRCSGPYVGAISKKDYQKNIRGIEMILSGKKKSLIKKLEKEMGNYAKKNEFEKAVELRNKIFALKHIQDVALISNDFVNVGTQHAAFLQEDVHRNVRIEAYDISNIGGDYAVGSMIVFSNNKPDKSQYRRFKIKTVAGTDDVGMMREILERRIKREKLRKNTYKNSSQQTTKKLTAHGLRIATEKWPKPDLIILDGGKGHLNMAEKLLRDTGWDIPIVAAAKGPTRKKLDLYYTKNAHCYFEIISDLTLLEKIRDEAHRFAIAYHRKRRRKEWIKNV